MTRAHIRKSASIDKIENAFLDQIIFAVDAKTFAKFQALLERPMPATDKLRRLLQTKVPCDK